MREDKLRRRLKNIEYIESKKRVPCMDCGGEFPEYCMDFHHLDEETKPGVGNKSIKHYLKDYSRKVIDEELAKCVLVCANCHRIRHHGLDTGAESL